MSTEKIYPVPANFAHRAYINAEHYRALYQRSVADPAAFWAEQAAEFVTWYRRWDRVEDWDYSAAKIRWFEGATLSVAYNCLDRHMALHDFAIGAALGFDDVPVTTPFAVLEAPVAVLYEKLDG